MHYFRQRPEWRRITMKVNNWTEAIIFIVYLVFMIGIGLFFFLRSKGAGEKEYFLGGRKMGPWVSALSAGASDMSAWVLMGLPTAIYAKGLGQVWIAVGLAIGYALSWLFEAKRLRAFSIVSDDAITIPQYLTRRFKSRSYALQVVCAVIFLIAYTIYAASSILEPRSVLTLCSPRTQRIASVTLLLPLPFGPTIAVIPLSNSIRVYSGNDLKP